MSTNEAARRQLWVFTDENGEPKPGAPGGPIQGGNLKITRETAGGSGPQPANLLVEENLKAMSRILTNLDDTITVWFSNDPNVTELTGSRLVAGAVRTLAYNGPIYIYTVTGSPEVECVEVLKE